MEGGAKTHGVDGQESILGKDEDDHFEQVAGLIRADGQLLGRIAVGIEVNDNQRVARGVTNVGVANAVPSSRAMDLHIPLL